MNLLTATERNSNLTALSKKIANEFGRSISQGAGDCTSKGESLFLCPKSIMVGVLGSLRACWLLDPVVQPDTPTALSLDASVGSLITIVKELAMSQHSYTIQSSKPNMPTSNVRLISLFTLLDTNKQSIANNLSFQEVKLLANKINGSVIKFQKMETVQ